VAQCRGATGTVLPCHGAKADSGRFQLVETCSKKTCHGATLVCGRNVTSARLAATHMCPPKLVQGGGTRQLDDDDRAGAY